MKYALIIFCLALVGCDQLKQPAARYQLVSDSSGHVWKIDTTTGDVWACAIGSAGNVGCWKQGDVVPR